MFCATGCLSEQINRLRRYVHIQKKRGASSLSLASRSKGPGIARLVETSNAESPTMIYIANTPEQLLITHTDTRIVQNEVYTPPQGVPVALFLTSHLNFPGS